MPPVTLLIKPASSLCNLRCQYCFYEDEAKNREKPSFGVMKEETLEAVIRKTLDYAKGACTIAWQGGEPTMAGLPFFEKAMDFVERYRKEGISVSHVIQTNGYRLGEDWVRFFAKHHFLVGLSLDGTKDTHNAFRVTPDGSDTFFDVMGTKDLLEKYGVDFNILTVVNSRTVRKPGKLYAFYRKYHLKYLQFIPCLDPFEEERDGGKGEGKSKNEADERVREKWDFSLDPVEYGHFLMELFDLWYEDLKKGEQPYIRSFENYIGILAGYEPEACDQRGVCGIQHVVEADGSVYPCDFYVLDSYRLGNLVTDSFEQLEERRKELRFLETSVHRTEGCRTCPYYAVCRGGCRRHRQEGVASAIGAFGPGKEPKNRFCESYRMFFDHSLVRMRRIAAELRGR